MVFIVHLEPVRFSLKMIGQINYRNHTQVRLRLAKQITFSIRKPWPCWYLKLVSDMKIKFKTIT